MLADSVTIAILTYRRPEYLERALLAASAQRGNIDEIMVVDNAADAELQTWLQGHFPTVRYLPMPYNAGCEGRNAALRVASSPVVFTIDDDVELVGSDCVLRALDAFNREPALACLNFKIVGRDGKVFARDWCHPRPIVDASRPFETYFILEGECAMRREAVLAAGGYSAGMFLYHEGLDLAYRLINQGARIEYTPDIAVVHYVAPDSGRAERYYYCSVRNGIWIAYQYLPPFSAILDAVGHTAKMTFFAARAGQLRAHMRGCAAAVRGMPGLNRQPLTRASLARLKAMREQRPAFLSRISRHLKERIL
ncbi:MAG: glycosyltransferase family 2 protein [Candidatus Binataceae bacterium]